MRIEPSPPVVQPTICLGPGHRLSPALKSRCSQRRAALPRAPEEQPIIWDNLLRTQRSAVEVHAAD